MFQLIVSPLTRLAVVGGHNWFGQYHLDGAAMTRKYKFSAAAMSEDPQTSLDRAAENRFERGYPNWEALIACESGIDYDSKYKAVPPDQRAQVVSVLTRNGTHYAIAKAAAEAGMAVLCEKPMTVEMSEANDLLRIVGEKNIPFLVMYTYCGFPMVKLARQLVLDGKIGDIIKVNANYKQGWLANEVHNWRDTEPEEAGKTCCLGDIGTHAYQSVRYVAGLTATETAARLRILDGGTERKLDDNFRADLILDNGALAEIKASQIEKGSLNDSSFEIVGRKGSIRWSMEDFSRLFVYDANGRIIAVHNDGIDQGLPSTVAPYSLLPSRHPEGHYGAARNYYNDLRTMLLGEEKPKMHVPGIHDGAAGVDLIEASLESEKQGGTSIALKHDIPNVDNSL